MTRIKQIIALYGYLCPDCSGVGRNAEGLKCPRCAGSGFIFERHVKTLREIAETFNHEGRRNV